MSELFTSPTIFTAVAYYFIGGVTLWVAMAVLATNPVNRVFLMGKYLTPEGARLLLRSWPVVFLFALFILSCAVEHHLHWLSEHGWPEKYIYVLFMGWIEAGISLITAAIILLGVIAWGVRKWTSK
jgi:hypothetical protein